MSRRDKGAESYFIKVVMVTVAVIWISLWAGKWIGGYIIEEGYLGKESDQVEFREMPSPRPKPWVAVDPKLEEELAAIEAESEKKRAPTLVPKVSVTATPVVEETPGENSFRLQFGAFTDRENAQRKVDELEKLDQKAEVEEISSDEGKVYRVRGGSFGKAAEAQASADVLREKGIQVFVVSE